MILSLPDELEGFVRDMGLRQAIDEGWDQAQADNLLSQEEVWAKLEEHKRKWHASRALNE
ncbi:MAG TPA: hypothetical protein VHM91_21000 [Verrucomicrobiales bacterium]|nr:hypothetical protein [Verrucomicrobiales bacterium]